jgi:hypothetical protein
MTHRLSLHLIEAIVVVIVAGAVGQSAAAASSDIQSTFTTRLTTDGSAAVPDEHVRSAQPAVASLIREGIHRSATFARLVEILNGSDVVAYIELRWRMPTGLDGYFAHWVAAAGGRRYVCIFVNTEFSAAHDQLIALMGHELQHAVEVAQAPDVESSEAVRDLFKRLDSGLCRYGCAETVAAIEIQASVDRELRADRSVARSKQKTTARPKRGTLSR